MWLRRPALLASVAVGLACGGIAPGESGIRGRVPEAADAWVPTAGELICASRHEESEEPPCVKVRGDGVFELPVPPGTYWLCARGLPLRCTSLCPYVVHAGAVTEVDPEDLRARRPEGQGFFGTSRGTFGEPGYLDVPHPLQVCVGPPGTGIHTPTAALTCTRTDRCGRYALSVPEGSYRVLFAEKEETTTSERQRCLYRVGAGQAIELGRVTGRARGRQEDRCGEGGTPDPVIGEELTRMIHEVAAMDPEQVPRVVSAELVRLVRDQLRAGQELGPLASNLGVEEAWLLPVVARALLSEVELRARLPPFIVTDARGVAFPRQGERYEDQRVHLHGPNFLGERGSVALRPEGGGDSFEVAESDVTWGWYEIAFAAPGGRPGGRYEVTVTRPNGLSSLPRAAIVVLEGEPLAGPDCARDPAAPGCTKDEAVGASEGPETLGVEALRRVLAPFERVAAACGRKHAAESGAELWIAIEVAGATGEVVSVRSTDVHAGAPLFQCVADAVKSARFPKFRRARQTFSQRFVM